MDPSIPLDEYDPDVHDHGGERLGGVDGPFSSPGPNSGTVAAASTAKIIPGYTARLGIRFNSDGSGTGTVYLLCGSVAQVGTVTASNFHGSFAPGGNWDGQSSQAVFSGPIQVLATAPINVGVLEA